MAAWEFVSELWEHTGEGSWHFVTVPLEVSEEIGDLAGPPSGFGSVRVSVTLGETSWQTSLFPDSASGCFVLPVKKAVRSAESVEAGDPVAVQVALAEA